MSRFKPAKDYTPRELAYHWFVQWAMWILVALPWRLVYWLSWPVGILAFSFQKKGRRRVMRNLHLAFGSKYNPLERWWLAARSYVTLALAMTESLKHTGGKQFDMPMIASVGLERLDAALAKGKGVILISSHFSTFGFAGTKLRELGYPYHVVSKRQESRVEEAFFVEMRRHADITFIYRDESSRALLRVLQSNKILNLFVDQTARETGGAWVNFFGHSFWTYDGAARLARKTGATVMTASIYRVGSKMQLRIGEPVTWEYSDDREVDAQRGTQAMVKAIEDEIRQCPDHWNWTQKPWKHLGIK